MKTKKEALEIVNKIGKRIDDLGGQSFIIDPIEGTASFINVCKDASVEGTKIKIYIDEVIG